MPPPLAPPFVFHAQRVPIDQLLMARVALLVLLACLHSRLAILIVQLVLLASMLPLQERLSACRVVLGLIPLNVEQLVAMRACLAFFLDL